jgi:hypothetical protein
MQELRIYFGGDIANLYDVGYLSTDIYQLIAFSELIDQKQDNEIRRWFGEKPRPFNRYASVLDKYRRSSDIREAKGGSLELVVAVASLVSNIVVPLVALYVQQQQDEKHPPMVSFEISVRDVRLQQVLNMFSEGYFGQGPQAIEALFQALRDRGYNVVLRANDAYVIHDTLKRYAQRMIRTMARP